MPSCRDCCDAFAGFILEYQTPKIVTVRSSRIGLLNRFVQILILSYIIGYAIIYQKGYQETDVAQSSIVAKVKGVASTKNRTDLPQQYRRVWDTPDYVIPPQENGAFFVLTNAIINYNQTQGICQEDPLLSSCSTSDPNACPPGESAKIGNGIYTGKCKSYDPKNQTVKTCEIEAWCPVQHDKLLSPLPLLPQTFYFTVLIKNSIEFAKFGVKSRNIIAKVNNDTYLKNCHYNEKTDPFCPVFQLGYIVERAKANYTELAINGGIINVIIKWNCNLDFSVDYCTPIYEFSRLDDANVKISPGWNFRYANTYHNPDGSLARDLIKAYGILFFVNVEGKAGRFNVVPLVLNIGAGLAILSLATVVCDIILLYCMSKREYYSEKKYLKVMGEDLRRASIGNISGHTDLINDAESPFDTPRRNVFDER